MFYFTIDFIFFFFFPFLFLHCASDQWCVKALCFSLKREVMEPGGDRSMVGGVSFQLTSKLCHFVASKGTTTAGWGLQLLLWHR